ncbi:MAG: hypothetical protein WB800_23870, partial [Streptosporangiaceae bacterium]
SGPVRGLGGRNVRGRVGGKFWWAGFAGQVADEVAGLPEGPGEWVMRRVVAGGGTVILSAFS